MNLSLSRRLLHTASRRYCTSVLRRRRPTIWASVILGLILLCYITVYSIWPNNKVVLPYDVDPNQIAPFEPDVVYDFPEGDPNEPKIPRIIHWTFRDTAIPPHFHANIRSLVDNNPSWTFYMWTDESSRKFVADTHPELLPTFDSYKDNICRADFIRYVVLYELGGVYADLDVINYRPLDRLLSKYTCIFPTEPFEHSVFRLNTLYLINNAIMICKPKHPFIKQLLEQIVHFVHYPIAVSSTGPSFVTTQYMMYNNVGWDDGLYKSEGSSSPYFYKGVRGEDDEDAVYIPNTQYFCNNVDEHAHFWFYTTCKRYPTLTELEKRACANLAIKGMVREKNQYAFLEHQFYRTYAWWHFYNYLDIFIYMFSKDIHELVPNIEIYKYETKTIKI